MKQLIVLLVLFVALTCLAACCIEKEKNTTETNNQRFETEDSTMESLNQYEVQFTLNSLTIYKSNTEYKVLLSDNPNKTVIYSSDRKCINSNGITLIKDFEVDELLNINYSELIAKLGEPQIDIGSGFYMPAYITENAYLIYFKVENGNVLGVVKRDLFTNEIISEASTF